MYEDKGIDYPFGEVRWTAKRNIESIINLVNKQSINIEPLISHKYKLTNISQAYGQLASSSSLGIILEYDSVSDNKLQKTINLTSKFSESEGTKKVGFVGAVNYATIILIPAFKKTNC